MESAPTKNAAESSGRDTRARPTVTSTHTGDREIRWGDRLDVREITAPGDDELTDRAVAGHAAKSAETPAPSTARCSAPPAVDAAKLPSDRTARFPFEPLSAGERAGADGGSGQPAVGRVRTAVRIGLRRGEVLGLRWSDVDLYEGVVTVRQGLSGSAGSC